MRPKNSRYDTDILRQAKDILRHFDYNCTHLQTCMKWFQVNRFSINTKYAMNMTCNTFLLDEIFANIFIKNSILNQFNQYLTKIYSRRTFKPTYY